jgi:hypothetical protein
MNQLGHESWHALVMTFGPPIFDLDVLAIDVALFGQALIEPGDAIGGRPCGLWTDEADNGHTLLRARCKRPRCSAAQNTEKLAPPHVRPLSQETASYRLKRVV